MLAVCGVLALAGCGGGHTTSRSTTGLASGAARAQRLVDCASVIQVQARVGSDLAALGSDPSNQDGLNSAFADSDALKTALEKLRGDVSDSGQRATVDQYVTVLGRLQASLRDAAAGHYGQANGQILGVAAEIRQASQQLTSGACQA